MKPPTPLTLPTLSNQHDCACPEGGNAYLNPLLNIQGVTRPLACRCISLPPGCSNHSLIVYPLKHLPFRLKPSLANSHMDANMPWKTNRFLAIYRCLVGVIFPNCLIHPNYPWPCPTMQFTSTCSLPSATSPFFKGVMLVPPHPANKPHISPF